jgi:hypothetical protein
LGEKHAQHVQHRDQTIILPVLRGTRPTTASRDSRYHGPLYIA